jgi:hypothetical protein
MALSFAKDIRPLFRAGDIDCMTDYGGFDLAKLSDVRRHAASIHERLADKSMPEDGAWSDENIAKFKQWMDEGMLE